MLLALERLFKNVALLLIDKNYRKYIFLTLSIGGKKRYKRCKVSINNTKVDVLDNRSFLAQYLEIFFQRSYQFTSSKDSPLIIDCGANIGTSVLFFKSIYPQCRIKAFEPDPIVYQVLSDNIDRHNYSDVEVINQAVWTEETTLNFASDGSDAGTITDTINNNTIAVKAIDLNNYLNDLGENIDMLKIDIEGAEYDVVLNCSQALRRVDNLFVECHSFPGQKQRIHQILKLLEDLDFRYYIQNENSRKSPFINRSKEKIMDMQLNIYAYREQNQ